MEIPYTVSARSDTGLWNAKIGIWLFLASEVMLFGGLFSSYIFLRLGADYPWPHGELNVPLGFINTIILILSSVFVVMAWASLKMRQYGNYLKWMSAVILCALIFLVNKGFEYHAKFEHKTVVLKDRSVLAGHLAEGASADIRFRAKYATVDFTNGNHRFLRFIENDARFFSEKGEVKMERAWFERYRQANRMQAKADYLGGEAARLEGEAEEAQGGASAQELRKRAEAFRRDSKALADEVKKSYPDLEDFGGTTSMRFELRPEAEISVPRKEITAWGDNELTFKDATVFEGLLESAMVKLVVDEIDLQEFFSRSEHGGADRDAAEAGVFRYVPEVQEAFVRRREEGRAEFESKKSAWERKHSGKTFPEPAYQGYDKVYLDKLHAHEGGSHEGDEKHGVGGGADAGGAGGGHGGHPTVEIPYQDIRFFSSYTPKKNTYYAIYFTLTGLHGLHVLGGALVLSFFLIFGKSLYRKNPEHLANRVEVGGLFWHFVDLVWIFLFPILYLM